MSVGEVIKQIRWELRLTQEALAKELGCAQTCVSSWELNQRHPNYAMLKKIDAFAKKNKIKVTLL